MTTTTTNAMQAEQEIMPRYDDQKVARLREVFEMVQDRVHWKNPINALVPEGSAHPNEIHEAVVFFTGSVPQIEAVEVEGHYRHEAGLVSMPVKVKAFRVRAAGYYATIGA